MDSLTQIVLGAAAGEVVLGKKIGNRAMIWGGVAGTIPDLDVVGKFFLSPIDNLAFHRGISHSIFFSVFAALILGWLVHRIYASSYHKWIATATKVLAVLTITIALDFIFQRIWSGTIIPTILLALSLSLFLFFHARKRYFKGTWQQPQASLRDWQWLFFWGLFTHPILDCFTMYGTQLFAPFSDVRISWGTISVADPLYTIPFLVCLLIAARFQRYELKRRVWNYSGIAISSLYMTFTVINKQNVNKAFETALTEQGIDVNRFVSNVAIFNNLLWSCTAESDSCYYVAQYSIFDEVPIQFNRLEKNHHLLKDIDTDYTVNKLRWFSDQYFTVIPIDDKLQFNDLRFGTFSGQGQGADDYIFKFLLTYYEGKGYEMEEAFGGPPEGKEEEIMARMFERMWGIKKDKI